VKGTYVFVKSYVLSLQLMFLIGVMCFLCKVTSEVRDHTNAVKVKIVLVSRRQYVYGLIFVM
jgi:hypothetical protein